MKTKVDLYARTYLHNISKLFSRYLGEMEVSSEEVIFRSPSLPLKSVRIKTKKSKFLLGGMVSLQIIGEFDNKSLVKDNSPIIIGYKGVVIKGNAYFNHRNQVYQHILKKLNGSKKLVDILSGLDLEKGEIHIGQEKLEIHLSPLSGSYMYMTVPPMHYTGTLPKSDIGSIIMTLFLICDVIERYSA